MTRYTRLERVAMAALAHDLRDEIPGLAGQFEHSSPSQRRNSGFGLFTEMVVDRNRPVPSSGPTGDLGTVHVMVGHLPDPIAFRARVRNGVLLGLLGDSYGQDTRAIDFATIAFDQVFTVDAQGRSVPFEAANAVPPPQTTRSQDQRPARPEPARVAQAAAPSRTPDRPAPTPTPPPAGPQTAVLDALFGARKDGAPAEPVIGGDEKAVLRVGLWFSLFVIAGVLVLVFEVNIVFVAIAAIALGRVLQTDKGLAAIRRGIDEWKKAQTRSS